MFVFKAEEFEDVMVFERHEVAAFCIVGQALLGIAFDGRVAFKKSGVDLAAEFTNRPAFADGIVQILKAAETK